MKRKLALLLAFAITAGTVIEPMGTLPVRAAEDTGAVKMAADGDDSVCFQYKTSTDGTITITKYTGTDADVVIPSEIEGKTVAAIGCSAFSNHAVLNSIKIPDSVTVIEFSVFNGCSNLETVEMPQNLKTIGDGVFYGCSSLTEIEIPNSVTDIGTNVFVRCSSLTEIEIPNGVAAIPDNTFFNCGALSSVKIPDSVTSIGKEAFWNCGSLKKIAIPDSVVSIGENAFQYVEAVVYCGKGSYAEVYANSQGLTVRDAASGDEEPADSSGGTSVGNTGNTPGGSGTEKLEQSIESAEDIVIKMGGAAAYLDAEAKGGGALAYESKDPDIASVNSRGEVTAVSAGTTRIVITAPETAIYQAGRKTVTVTVIPEDYTEIRDISGLSAIRNDPAGKYILTKDIDMTQATASGGDNDCGTGWDSIESFSGTLDGNGHKIIGMRIEGEIATQCIGLFESLKGTGTVKNLGMVDSNIGVRCKYIYECHIGAIAGESYGTIENCYTGGSITVEESIDSFLVGGLVGYNGGTINNCFNACDINVKNEVTIANYIGGICGERRNCQQCYNTGIITGNDKSVSGAIVGRWGSLTNCHYRQGSAAKGCGTSTDNANCVALTEAQMKNGNYFTGFDFTDIWEVDPYCSYPYPQLQNNRMIRVASIELDPAPSKLVYSQGEPLRTRGAGLKILYEDGKETTITPLPADALSGYDMTQIGRQTVVVNYGNAETAFDIEVQEVPVSGITLPQQITLDRSKEQRLTAAITPDNASNPSVTWQSDAPNVASVDNNGLVKAKAGGTAVITATSANGLQAYCTVTVRVPAVAIDLEPTVLVLKAGERYNLYAQISPLESTEILRWRSANTAVAEVSDGTVTARSAGTTTISAYTDSGAAASCTVTVQKSAPSGGGTTVRDPGSSGTTIRNPGSSGTTVQNPDSTSSGARARAIRKVKATKARIKSAKNVKTRSIKLKLSGRSDCTGYKIQYGLKKNFKGAKTLTKKSGTVTIKKLKAKKTYYVRVQTYKKIAGKTYYGKWSGRKAVKIKK